MQGFGCFSVLLVVLLGGVAFGALVLAVSLRRRLEEAEARLAALEPRLAYLEGEPPAFRAPVAAAPSGVSQPAVEDVRPTVSTEPSPAFRIDLTPPSPPQQPPRPPDIITQAPQLTPPSPATGPELDQVQTPPLPATFVTEPDLAWENGTTDQTSAQIPSPPPPPSRPAASFDWENLIGVKLFSWIAGVALVLAAVFFLRYSIEHGWLSPPVQMAIGLLAGVTLIVLSELKIADKYRTTANAFDAAGIAILYATLFAAHSIWHLIGTFPDFLLMAAVTALAVFLSIRRDSLFIALLGLLAGFATPSLLSTGEDRPISLFGYLLVLNVGLAWVAYKKRWSLLTAISFVLTTLYQWWWVVRFLDATELPIAVGIFLIFPLVSVIALSLGARGSDEKQREFGWSASWSAAVPLLFAVYASAIPAYASNFRLLFGFLLIVSAGLAALAAARDAEILHTFGAIGTVLALVLWSANSYTSQAWPLAMFITILFLVVYYAAPLLAFGFGRPYPSGGQRAAQIATLILFFFPALIELEPAASDGRLLFPTLLAVLIAIGIYAARFANPLLFVIAAFFGFVAQLIWTLDTYEAKASPYALIVYTAFAIAYLGAPLFRRVPFVSRAQYFVLTSFLLLSIFSTPSQNSQLGFLSALGVITLASVIAAHAAGRGLLQLLSFASYQVVLISWIFEANRAPWPTVALILAVLGGVAAFLSWQLAERSVSLASKANRFADGALLALLLGQLVGVTGSYLSGRPDFLPTLLSHLALVILLLTIARKSERHVIAVVAALTTLTVAFTWIKTEETPHLWPLQLLFGFVLYVPFLLYPLILGKRIGRSLEPHLAAILFSAGFFFYARPILEIAGFEPVIGLLPVIQALLLGGLLLALLRTEKKEEREEGRLATVAGAALAFLTVAIPLQFDKEWITLGWALEAAALSWLYTKIRHRGLLAWTAGLGAIVFARLVLNPAVFEYHPRGSVPILNWYLYAYMVAAFAFFLAAYFLRKTDDSIPVLPRLSSLFSAAATVLLFLLLNIEIADYYSTGEHLTFNFSAGLAQDLTYTLAWALFAIALLVTGIAMHNRAARISSLALLVVAILKCFLHDLARLGGLYRVGSLLGLALCLGVVAILIQKFVLAPKERLAEETRVER